MCKKLGEQGNKSNFREQGNKNQDFDKQSILFFWRTREQVPSPHPGTYDLEIMQ